MEEVHMHGLDLKLNVRLGDSLSRAFCKYQAPKHVQLPAPEGSQAAKTRESSSRHLFDLGL
jgi:hypothetical protein